MKRHIMHIAALPAGDESWPCLFALATDGTLWSIDIHADSEGWSQIVELPDAPDDEVKADYEIVDERTARIEKAIATIDRLHSLGDAIYDVRNRHGGDTVDGVPFTGSSWEHPIVGEYSDAVKVLQDEKVIR